MLLDRWTRPLLEGAMARAGAGFDVAVVRIAQELAKRATRREQSPEARRAYLDSVAERYGKLDPAEFYAAPPKIARVHERFVRDLDGGSVTDASWESGWEPRDPVARGPYLAWKENATSHVRLLSHARPAPAIICIHGYRAGAFRFEERAWSAEWLYRLGLDVALFTLPFHALRAPASRRRTPLFPTADVARTNEAFGQATWDLRSLATWLRARGSRDVGVAGMSLGGYTAALLATVEPALAFAVPFIPVGDMTDVVVDHEALRGTVVPPALIDAGKRAMAIHRPLARAPQVSGDRVLVVAAEGDRITKPSHAELLARHFGAELVLFPGAHLLQFGRRAGFAAIARLLSRLGVIEGKAGAAAAGG